MAWHGSDVLHVWITQVRSIEVLCVWVALGTFMKQVDPGRSRLAGHVTERLGKVEASLAPL